MIVKWAHSLDVKNNNNIYNYANFTEEFQTHIEKQYQEGSSEINLTKAQFKDLNSDLLLKCSDPSRNCTLENSVWVQVNAAGNERRVIRYEAEDIEDGQIDQFEWL